MSNDTTHQSGSPQPSPTSHPTPRLPNRHALSLAHQLGQGKASIGITFAGNGVHPMGDLEELFHSSPVAREWIEAASRTLAQLAQERPFRWSGLCPNGIDLLTWIRNPDSRPSDEALTASLLSQPLIFAAQIGRYLQLYHAGLNKAFAAGAVRVTTGYSQGMMPALLVAERADGAIPIARALEILTWFTWQGLLMQQAYDDLGNLSHPDPSHTPMASITGLTEPQLAALLHGFNARLPEHLQITLSIHVGHRRAIVSGAPASLARLRDQLEQRAARDKKLKSAG
ncbi:MAG: hypothetical protein AAFX99_31800, partial [Myxococcota bacterium]